MKNFLTACRLLLPGLLLIAACGQDSVESTPVSEVPQSESAAPPTLTRSPSAEGAQVFFITPSDGDNVASPVQVEFGLAIDIVLIGAAIYIPVYLFRSMRRVYGQGFVITALKFVFLGIPMM